MVPVLVQCRQNGFTTPALLEDGVDGGGPDERLGVVAPGLEEVPNGGDQVGHAGEDAAAQRLLGEPPKPALDEVQPGAAGGGEVQMEARHMITVGRLTDRRRAIALLVPPCAASSTIRGRSATLCGVPRAPTKRSSSPRCSAETIVLAGLDAMPRTPLRLQTTCQAISETPHWHVGRPARTERSGEPPLARRAGSHRDRGGGSSGVHRRRLVALGCSGGFRTPSDTCWATGPGPSPYSERGRWRGSAPSR